MDKRIGHYSFLGGVLLSLVLGLFSGFIGATTVSALILVLVVLGLIVGLLNISAKETKEFLLAAVALIVIGLAGTTISALNSLVSGLGTVLQAIVTNISVFVAPAALIVSLKLIVEMAEK